MGDFNARLNPNFTKSLPDLFGSMTFAHDIDEDSYPSTNLFHLTKFMSSSELSAISTMRPRPPGLLVTYQDIVAAPPPPTFSTLDSYAVLDYVICRQEHRFFFRSIRSHTSVALPWHHRYFLISASPHWIFLLLPPSFPFSLSCSFNPTSLQLHLLQPPRLQSTSMDLALTNTQFPIPIQPAAECTLPIWTSIFLDLLDLCYFSLKVLITLPNCRHH